MKLDELMIILKPNEKMMKPVASDWLEIEPKKRRQSLLSILVYVVIEYELK